MSDSIPLFDTKLCKSCLQEKSIGDFSTYRKPSGEQAYRNVCKACKWKREKKRLSNTGESLPLFSDDDMPLKRCNTCFEWKSENSFHPEKKACITCEERIERERQLLTLEMQHLAAKNANIRYHERHPHAKRSQKLAHKYGLTIEAYHQMCIEQDFRCAICGSQPEDGTRLYVDHCHRTGKVRGLLCRACNSGIGLMHDNPTLLENAIEYLKKYA